MLLDGLPKEGTMRLIKSITLLFPVIEMETRKKISPKLVRNKFKN